MDDDWLVWRYEASRPRLRSMAYRMLGSVSDADDAVQESWIHVAGGDSSAVANLEGWFTTIVARVCLDMLRARKSRPEHPVDAADLDFAAGASAAGVGAGADAEAVLADTVGIAMLVVLDTLGPAERVAFVLHEMFGLPFAEIAAITGRSPASARQLASRARRRIRVPASPGSEGSASGSSASGSSADAASAVSAVSASGVPVPGAGSSGAGSPVSGSPVSGVSELARQRALADAFLTAARGGDMKALLAVLDPDVVLHGDAIASQAGKPITIRGATKVARASRAAAPRTRYSGIALINGVPGIVHAPHGRLATVLAFRYGPRSAAPDSADGVSVGAPAAGTTVITAIDVIADPSHLAALELAVPD